jgi:DNA repair protein SbcD/Mre11
MLVLHTSDWHLGRSLHRYDLSAAHEAFVDHLVATVRAERVDLVVVSGDVHDRAIPPIGAIRLFTEALGRIRDAGASVVVISGNHDGPDRLGDKAALLDARIQIRTDPAAVADPVVHTDAHGPVRVYALPYLEPAAALNRLPAEPTEPEEPAGLTDAENPTGPPDARAAELDFGDWAGDGEDSRAGPGSAIAPTDGPTDGDGAGRDGGGARESEPARDDGGPPARPTHAAVVGRAMSVVRADLARHPARAIVLAHAWVTSGTPSESERAITVGGTPSVPERLFDGVTYTALGHLHRPQAPREGLRYSGSPLPFSFSEARDRKRMLLVELGPSGLRRVEEVPLPVHRPLRELRGSLDDLMTSRAYDDVTEALVSAVLTDAVRPLDAMATLRRRFPHTLLLTHAPDIAVETRADPRGTTGALDDLSVAEDFVREVRSGAAASAVERGWLTRALDAARLAEDGAELPGGTGFGDHDDVGAAPDASVGSGGATSSGGAGEAA